MSDFGDYNLVKTRKDHSCVYCGRTIPKGTKAFNCKGLFEGDWQNWYACQFCDREVVPDYAEPNDYISGDEFNEWFLDQDYFKCKKCENMQYRHHNDWEWISSTKIKVECGDCGNTWEVEIGFI